LRRTEKTLVLSCEEDTEKLVPKIGSCEVDSEKQVKKTVKKWFQNQVLLRRTEKTLALSCEEDT
jgi:hypothetical protein